VVNGSRPISVTRLVHLRASIVHSSSSPVIQLPIKPAKLPAYQWLRNSLQDLILTGTLPSGFRIPATRELALQYGLARGTVLAAIEELKSEGYLSGRHGSGTYVSSVLPDTLLKSGRTRPSQRESFATEDREYRLSSFANRLAPFSHFVQPRTLAFRTNLPALDLFPTLLWNQVLNRRLRRRSTTSLLGCKAMGHPRLRAVIATYLRTSRGVTCQPEQVLVLSGIQEAVDLASRLLIDPGDTVALEDPGYPAARTAFLAAGAKILPIPVDAEGAVITDRRLLVARLIYVTPSHQFPTGATMSLRRRLAVLDVARRGNSIIFEDDYDSEYRYSGRPLSSLHGLDRHHSVIFAGSFNKVLFPSLRLAYMVVPPALVDVFSRAKHLATRHHPLLEQEAVADFIEEGHFTRHLRRMRKIYGERLETLLECSQTHLGGLLSMSPIEAGLQTTAQLEDGLLARDVATAALRNNIDVVPVVNYCLSTADYGSMLQIGFAAVDERSIRKGVITLAQLLQQMRAGTA
jgi:GntR family transcriptional regulator/MocR family aminotransferase